MFSSIFTLVFTLISDANAQLKLVFLRMILKIILFKARIHVEQQEITTTPTTAIILILNRKFITIKPRKITTIIMIQTKKNRLLIY